MQILSASATCSMEEIAATGPGLRLFQLYVSEYLFSKYLSPGVFLVTWPDVAVYWLAIQSYYDALFQA